MRIDKLNARQDSHVSRKKSAGTGGAFLSCRKSPGLHKYRQIPNPTYHGTAKRLMGTVHYLGDSFYPAIIDKETFIAAGREIKCRSAKLGRNDRFKEIPEKKAPILFRFGDITEPYLQLLHR